MIIVTTPTVPGTQISRIFGIVCAESVIHVFANSNKLKKVKGAPPPITGYQLYAGNAANARQSALSQLAAAAEQMGANAVVSAQVNYTSFQDGTINGHGNDPFYLVSAQGTAVKIQPMQGSQNT